MSVVQCEAFFHFLVLELHFSHAFSSRAIVFVLVFTVHLRHFFPARVRAADTKKQTFTFLVRRLAVIVLLR